MDFNYLDESKLNGGATAQGICGNYLVPGNKIRVSNPARKLQGRSQGIHFCNRIERRPGQSAECWAQYQNEWLADTSLGSSKPLGTRERMRVLPMSIEECPDTYRYAGTRSDPRVYLPSGQRISGIERRQRT